MTKEQQKTIINLKNNGYSLSQIASRLGIPKNTVKSFCQRNITRPPSISTCSCEQCGYPLPVRPDRKPPRFCSDKCRSAWWNLHQDQLSGNAMIEIVCAHCGIVFRAFPSKHRSYCSRQCYIHSRYGSAQNDE